MDRLGGAFGSHDSHSDEHDIDDTHTDGDPPSPVGQDERRMQVRAYNHWASLLGDGNLPDIEDLEPERLDDFGPYSVLLDFSSGIDNPAIRFIGTELRQECDALGMIDHLSDVPPRSLLSRITDHYMQILANQAPIGFEAEFVNQREATVLYRGILLPYSSDDETIDFIFGVINWKELADSRTSDELLLEIDQSLETDDAASFDDPDDVGSFAFETAETLTAETTIEEARDTGEDGNVFDLAREEVTEETRSPRLPLPRFGFLARRNRHGDDEPKETVEDTVEAVPAKRERGFDALGNPLGGARDDEPHEHGFGEESDSGFGDDGFDSGMKTAADYGLPDWDEEPEGEDVDDVVDPLADDESESSLVSLVHRGEKLKKAVDLGAFEMLPAEDESDRDDETDAAISLGFGEDAGAPDVGEELEDPWAEARADFEAFEEPVDNGDNGLEAENSAEPMFAATGETDKDAQPAFEDDEATELDVPAMEPVEPAGLHDYLAQAREMAQAALNTEDRSRKALYDAVGRAYDFSLEATAEPEEFAEIMADNGLTMQDRAPMTPVVKLVFGADYDKTRLTEYAAVLTYAHRRNVERGQLATFLREAEGGLKAVVQAERRARKEEQGKPVEETDTGIRKTLARKLRKLGGMDFSSLGVTGPEFALVMVRRTEDGRLLVLGELPEDRATLEKAGRKLLAK